MNSKQKIADLRRKLEAAEAERDEIKAAILAPGGWDERCKRAESERDALREENARLRTALAYYAEQRNYRLAAGDKPCTQHGGIYCGMEHRDAFNGYDGRQPGSRARAALAEPAPEKEDRT